MKLLCIVESLIAGFFIGSGFYTQGNLPQSLFLIFMGLCVLIMTLYYERKVIINEIKTWARNQTNNL